MGRNGDHEPELGPELAPVQINLARPKTPVTARLVESRSCMNGRSASFVRHWSIDLTGSGLEGTFRAGQAFGVLAPGLNEKGKPHNVRLYSIACPTWGEDGEGRIISTTVKRVLDERKPQRNTDDKNDHSLFVGVCSNYMCDIKEGAEVLITGPAGKRFVLPAAPEEHNYVFMATGTGIAPFRGFVKELLERPGGAVPGAVHLVMGVPYSTDLLYHQEFLALAEKHPSFHYRQAISREHYEGRWGRYTHHVVDDDFDAFRDTFADPSTLIYMCGMAGMEVGMYQCLAANGAADGFLRIPDELKDVPPWDWDWEVARKRVRPTKRCLVEVY
jgi:ferredoxin--NADP+ reductase